MKRMFVLVFLFCCSHLIPAQAQSSYEYVTSVTFPANYAVGDYIEFVKVDPIAASAAGYFEISIAYTRGNIAAAATHLASISHYNPDLWREVGRINSNGYSAGGTLAFTVDCNTIYGNSRFRIRATNVAGVQTEPMYVNIKIRSINFNTTWLPLSATGNDLTVTKFLPMTNNWSLYVGNPFSINSAALAFMVTETGNVGIGTKTPDAKLTVAGDITAKKIKVTNSVAPWPDYVFETDYKLPSIPEVEKFVAENKHLPGVPSGKTIEAEGHDLGEMNKRLLQKIEEQMLYIIEMDKRMKELEKELRGLKKSAKQD